MSRRSTLASAFATTDARALTIPQYTYPYTPYCIVIWLPSYPASASNPMIAPAPLSRPVNAPSTNWDPTPYPFFSPNRTLRPRYTPHGPTSRNYSRNFMDTYYGTPPPAYPARSSYVYPTYPPSWTQGPEYAQWR